LKVNRARYHLEGCWKGRVFFRNVGLFTAESTVLYPRTLRKYRCENLKSYNIKITMFCVAESCSLVGACCTARHCNPEHTWPTRSYENLESDVCTEDSEIGRRDIVIVVVLRADSPGKAAQWFAESIPESWGVLWLVIRFLSGRADVSSSVITAFFLVLHSPPHLSAYWSSPRHYQYFSYLASADCQL
jgi:hypothetical protein